jgi:hypothetical protein
LKLLKAKNDLYETIGAKQSDTIIILLLNVLNLSDYFKLIKTINVCVVFCVPLLPNTFKAKKIFEKSLNKKSEKHFFPLF